MKSRITGFGSYLPEIIVTNEDLAKKIDTSDEWIFTRTGIKQRRIAAENEFSSDLAYMASKDLLERFNIDPNIIDLILVATTSSDKIFPSTACYVQKKLGIHSIPCFDLQAVCSGFVYGLSVADAFIKSGSYKNILLIGVDTMSKILDWKDRKTCVLFGDGAGAVLISKSEEEGIIRSYLGAEGSADSILYSSGNLGKNETAFVVMEGTEVYKMAIEKMEYSIKKLLEDTNYKIEDIDLLVPHQANIRIMEKVAQNLGIKGDKVINIIENMANNSAATIPLALDFAYRTGRIKNGSLVMTCAAGAGFTWGGNLIRF